MERLLILDGNSLMNRAFYALPPLTTPEGIHTNAVYGFTTMLIKMKEELKPNYIVTTFDRKAPTFRHKEYKDYKAGRKRMPDELFEQFPIVKDLLNKMAINIFEIDGFEADDLIGTLSVEAEKRGIEVYIITGDRDALQLATDNVKVVINKKGMTEKEIYDKNRMIEDFGVTPTEFIDVKGLMGDKSDNIPGVPGIGEKTAYKLIKEYKSIESVLENVEDLKGKIKENLIQYCEQAIFSKKLATIMTNVPVDIDFDSIKSKENYDTEGLRELFYKLQFVSLIKKLPKSKKEIENENIDIKTKNIDDIKSLKSLSEKLEKNIFLTYKVSKSDLYSNISIDTIYMSFNDVVFILNLKDILKENKEETIKLLKVIFEGNSKKIIHSSKSLYTALSKLNIEINNMQFDTEISAYLINSAASEYSLKVLLDEYLRITVSEDEEIKKAYYLKDLYEELNKKIEEEDMNNLLYKVEEPLISVLSSMESNGFRVDKDKLLDLGEDFSKQIETMKSEIFNLSGEEFNINSPKQLGKILFEKLDLPVIKKTKTGYSTNAEVLEKLSDKHPIIEKITSYRQLAKLYSTYVEGLKNVIDVDGKIHSSFNQTVTTTGRLSSTEPNLQNIPIRQEMGRKIRTVFVPNNEECVILSADYSQIELRVLAHIAGDENLINAFKHHSDIHTKTASEVFNVPIEEVTPTMRSNAKAVNFGIVYGIGDFSLSEDLKISRKEAKSYIDTYFERYPNVKRYMDNIVKEAEEKLYVTTIMNRRRFIPEISSSNKIVKSLGKRLTMNAPIQGSAADIIKLAMVNVFEELNKRKLKSTIILQVHDEIILNVYKDELDEVKTIVKDKMENVVDLSVPLEVDINVGKTWYEAK